MSIKHAIATSGFLLIEVITACTMLTVMALPLAYYQWHSIGQNTRVSQHIALLLSLKNCYERELSYGTEKLPLSQNVAIVQRLLPVLVIDEVPLQPVCYEGTYRVGNKQYTYTFISTVFPCR